MRYTALLRRVSALRGQPAPGPGPDPDPPEPVAPTNLRATSVTSSQVVLAIDDTNDGQYGYEWYRGGILLDITAAGVASFSDNTVQPEQSYTYEVRTVGMGSGPTLVVNTPQEGAVEPLFADDFESYPIGGVPTGGSNGWSRGAARNVQISDDRAYSGTRSLKFIYEPYHPDTGLRKWAEQRFSHPHVTEYWIEYYWYCPANYYHVPGNNKFHSYWGTTSDASIAPSGTFQTWERYPAPNTGGHSIMRVNTWGPSGEHYPSVPGNQNRLFLTESHRGQWHRIRMHFRLSDIGQNNGVSELWRNDDLIVYVYGDDNNATTTEANLIGNGYLMGSPNGQYTEPTYFYIDAFKFYVNDPGW